MRQLPRRFAVLAGLGLIALALVVFVITRHHAPASPIGTGSGSASGKAPSHAPRGPHLPGTPNDGTHLTGFVVDGAGIAVTGAEVSCELEKGGTDRALAPKPAAAFKDAGVSSGSAATPAMTVAVAAPTGADGHFELDDLVPGRYRLRVTGPGLLAAEVRFVPVPSDEARIVVARQIGIDGTVTDGGKPVANATVGIRSEAIGGALEIKSDSAGAFHVPKLPEGRYQVYGWQGALAARTIRVARLGAGPFAPVELRLEAGEIVVGRVVDRGEGTGLVAAIELRPSGDDQAPRYARSGDDGVFRIEGVPNGKWIADAYAPGYLSGGGVEIDAKSVPELALQRGATIEGRVLDGGGKPIAGASVRAITAGTNPTEYSGEVDQDRLRRFSGRTATPTLAPTTALGSDPELIARGELGVLIGPIPPVPPQGAQIARPSAVIDPTAANASLVGEPPALTGDPARASIWTTGADGCYRIAGVGKGKLAALAIAGGFAEARSKQVSLEAGEVATNVDIVLTAGTFIVGRVTDQHDQPVIGAEVSAQPEVGSASVNFTDADGMYRVGPVAGQIALKATAYGHVEVTRAITLPPSKNPAADEHRENLVLEVADASLVGTVADASGLPIGNAQLEVLASGGDQMRRGVSALDGAFSLDMLPHGQLRVRISHPDYPTVELAAVAGAAGERVRLVVPLGGSVEGALLDGSKGLAGVTLTAKSGAGLIETSTESNGKWKLGPLAKGHWKIEVKLPGYLPFARDIEVPAAMRAGSTTVRDIRIDLARGALVGGTVRDGRGQRVANAHVVVRSATSEAEGDADAQGEFRIHDAPTGDVSVEASRGDAIGSTHVTVRAGDEVLGLAVEIR